MWIFLKIIFCILVSIIFVAVCFVLICLCYEYWKVSDLRQDIQKRKKGDDK